MYLESFSKYCIHGINKSSVYQHNNLTACLCKRSGQIDHGLGPQQPHKSRNLVLCPAQPGLLIVMKKGPQL